MVAIKLATIAAYKLALIEDFILLLGIRAEPRLREMNVFARNLDRQTGLFADNPTPISRSILESVLEGIRLLRERNHHGEYCAIVAPDLYQRAFQPRTNAMDAPIYEIRPLLREGGFQYSPAAPEGTGVIFSLGGSTVDLAVLVDMMAELTDEENGIVFLRTVEQFRQRINDPTAIVALT